MDDSPSKKKSLEKRPVETIIYLFSAPLDQPFSLSIH